MKRPSIAPFDDQHISEDVNNGNQHIREESEIRSSHMDAVPPITHTAETNSDSQLNNSTTKLYEHKITEGEYNSSEGEEEYTANDTEDNIINCLRIVPRYLQSGSGNQRDTEFISEIQLVLLQDIYHLFQKEEERRKKAKESRVLDLIKTDEDTDQNKDIFSCSLKNEVYEVKYHIEYVSEDLCNALVLTISAVTLMAKNNPEKEEGHGQFLTNLVTSPSVFRSSNSTSSASNYKSTRKIKPGRKHRSNGILKKDETASSSPNWLSSFSIFGVFGNSNPVGTNIIPVSASAQSSRGGDKAGHSHRPNSTSSGTGRRMSRSHTRSPSGRLQMRRGSTDGPTAINAVGNSDGLSSNNSTNLSRRQSSRSVATSYLLPDSHFQTKKRKIISSSVFPDEEIHNMLLFTFMKVIVSKQSEQVITLMNKLNKRTDSRRSILEHVREKIVIDEHILPVNTTKKIELSKLSELEKDVLRILKYCFVIERASGHFSRYLSVKGQHYCGWYYPRNIIGVDHRGGLMKACLVDNHHSDTTKKDEYVETYDTTAPPGKFDKCFKLLTY